MRLLDGVKVLELGTTLTAPFATMLLADLGADVVKVENPDGGDPFRSFRGGLYSPHFVAYNKNKRSISLDLRADAGREQLLELVDVADVLVDNFRPGVLERLRIGWDQLHARNPRLIHCSITGFGSFGPYRDRPAFDTVAQALSGVLSMFVDPADPNVVGPTISDNVGGIFAAYGVLGALYERTRSGVGRRLEVNMLEATMAFVPDPYAVFTQLGIVSGQTTRVAASQSYTLACADGKMLGIHLSSPEKFWQGLCVALERPELAADPRFATRMLRLEHYEALRAELKAIAETKPRAYWTARLEAHDVPFAPVHAIDEALVDPQVVALGTVYRSEHPTEGAVHNIRRPVFVDGERSVGDRAAPTLGEHNAELLGPNGEWSRARSA